jgi:hypothetical protein
MTKYDIPMPRPLYLLVLLLPACTASPLHRAITLLPQAPPPARPDRLDDALHDIALALARRHPDAASPYIARIHAPSAKARAYLELAPLQSPPDAQRSLAAAADALPSDAARARLAPDFAAARRALQHLPAEPAVPPPVPNLPAFTDPTTLPADDPQTPRAVLARALAAGAAGDRRACRDLLYSARVAIVELPTPSDRLRLAWFYATRIAAEGDPRDIRAALAFALSQTPPDSDIEDYPAETAAVLAARFPHPSLAWIRDLPTPANQSSAFAAAALAQATRGSTR